MATNPAVGGIADIGDPIVLAAYWLNWREPEPGGEDNAVTEVPVR